MNLRDFTIDEWHCFIIGLCEPLCPKHRVKMPAQVLKMIESEWWYYRAGNVIGVVAWIIIAKIAQVVFW